MEDESNLTSASLGAEDFLDFDWEGQTILLENGELGSILAATVDLDLWLPSTSYQSTEVFKDIMMVGRLKSRLDTSRPED